MTAASPETLNDHWSGLGERGIYLGLRSMLAVYRVLGRRAFVWLLYPVIAYFFLTNRTARKASLDYLRRIHGVSGSGAAPGWGDSFRHFLSFGEALGDKVAAWAGDITAESIVIVNEASFERLRQSGRGGILITCHLGNAEVCRAVATTKPDIRFTALMHTAHSQNFMRLLDNVAPQSAFSVLQTTEVTPATAIAFSERIERGEFIVIAGDRTPASRSARVVRAPFLGRPAPFPQGPYVLAAVLKCPVLLVFCLKRGDRHHVIFETFSDGFAPSRQDRPQWIETLVRRYAARLECHCLEAPAQWFNFFDFWGQNAAGNPVPSVAGGLDGIRPDVPKGL